MNGDNPVQGKLDDISYLKDKCSFYDLNNSAGSLVHDNSFSNSRTTAILIFVTYLLLNVLILILTMLYLDKVFSWIEQPQRNHLKDLYKASAIVLVFINPVSFGSDILLHIFFWWLFHLSHYKIVFCGPNFCTSHSSFLLLHMDIWP